MCKKGFCIICRKDEQEMSDEHVIPEAIGGYYHIYSRSLKDALPLNSQQINMRFALRYLQVFVSLRLKTCRLYDKQDLSPALIVQFVGRPTEPQASLVSARRQD